LLPPDADLNEYKRQKVDGLCPNGDECTSDSTCSKLKVCTSSSSNPGGSSSDVASGGCSCHLATPEGEAGALLVAAMGAAAALQRRRSRQRRA